MKDIIALAVIMAVLGFAIWRTMSKNKRGMGCVGCPYAENCQAREEK